MQISLRSSTGKAALILKLYEGAYQLNEGGTYTTLNGSINPGLVHLMHIQLNMDSKKYSICINGEVVVKNKNFLSAEFEDFEALKFYLNAEITEAFESIYLVDDIRISK